MYDEFEIGKWLKEGWVKVGECWNKVEKILTNEFTMMNEVGPPLLEFGEKLANMHTLKQSDGQH